MSPRLPSVDFSAQPCRAPLGRAFCQPRDNSAEHRADILVVIEIDKEASLMNLQLSALAIILLVATGAQAQEAATPSSTNTAAEDCSKQVWPNFTPSCLRNSDKATNVRLVSTERR